MNKFIDRFCWRHWFTLCSVSLGALALWSCATTGSPKDTEVEKLLTRQDAAMSRSSYEQLRPAIEEIRVGDSRAKILNSIPQKEEGKVFELKQGGKLVGLLFDYNWPGVLTPFNHQGYLKPESLDEMHLGYLEDGMLRLKKVIIFKDDKVSQILSFSPPNEQLESGKFQLGKEIGLLGHLSKEDYEKVFLPRKDQIVPGMHVFEVFGLFNANYRRNGQSYIILCPSYLNYKTGAKAIKTAEGVRVLFPFGYLEGDTEIIKWEVEMLNNRVTAVRPYGQ
jgi:hypothetical protein